MNYHDPDQVIYDILYGFRMGDPYSHTEGPEMKAAAEYCHQKGYVQITKHGTPTHFKFIRRPEDD
jgi:hypothetical protein